VLSIWEHRRRTIVFITHNLEEAVFLGDRVIMLSTKPARIVADIPVDLQRPRNPVSADFTALRARCANLLQEMHADDASKESASKHEA